MTEDSLEAVEVLRHLRHDARTPLAVVMGFADLLAGPATVDDATRCDYATKIGEAAREIRELLDAVDRV